jgi:hypothetical protein
MKKIARTAAVALFCTFALTSCKKDYTCSCNDDAGDKQDFPINDVKKKDAKKACDAWGIIWATTDNGKCTLK